MTIEAIRPPKEAFSAASLAIDYLYLIADLALVASSEMSFLFSSSMESFFFLDPVCFLLFIQGELSRFDFSPRFMHFMA